MNYTPSPTVAAFLLAGGASSRMGSDKALLQFRANPLLVHMAKLLGTVSESIHIVAPPGRYESFGYPILSDKRSQAGPLAGIEAALERSPTDWSLIVACDLPLLTRDWLLRLIASATAESEAQLIATESNPLCAVWHKSALTAVRDSLESEQFRVKTLVSQLKTQILIPPDPGILANWNRPQDLAVDPGE